MKSERQAELWACAQYADRLVDLSDGDLADTERQSIEAHVATCAGCHAELARLDASLAVLRRTGFQPFLHGTRSAPTTYYAAAALSLVLLLAATWGALRIFGPDGRRETAQIHPPRQEVGALKTDAEPPDVASAPLLDEAAVLHHIALVEQQARLQASLDLMPKDPWFAEQRAATEELLAKFKAATVSVTQPLSDSSESDAGNAGPCAGETL